MNLIEMKQKVVLKDKERNVLIGKHELLMENLEDLGFTTIADAEKEIKKLNKEVETLKKKYDNDISKFKNKYGHLLT